MNVSTIKDHEFSSPPANLLTIPPEIREMIYAYLPDAEAFHLTPRHRTGDQDLLRDFKTPALGQVHPLLRAELQTRMYSEIRLDLSRTSDTAAFTRWLGLCGDNILACIKTITFSVPWEARQPLTVTLGAEPHVHLKWLNFYHATLITGTAARERFWFEAQCVDRLRDAQALALAALEENMPLHPRYDRRVWTKEAWVVVKDVVFTSLQCRAARYQPPAEPWRWLVH